MAKFKDIEYVCKVPNSDEVLVLTSVGSLTPGWISSPRCTSLCPPVLPSCIARFSNMGKLRFNWRKVTHY